MCFGRRLNKGKRDISSVIFSRQRRKLISNMGKKIICWCWTATEKLSGNDVLTHSRVFLKSAFNLFCSTIHYPVLTMNKIII